MPKERRTEEFRRSRSIASDVLDSIGSIIIVLDPSGHIRRMNKSAESFSGYELISVRGRRLTDLLLAPSDAENFERTVASAAAGARIQGAEHRWITQ
ncbi:MAG: PAS domain-containing protein, partial [Acidobacteriota bacterium]